MKALSQEEERTPSLRGEETMGPKIVVAAWDQMLVIALCRFKNSSNMSYDCFAALSGLLKLS